MYDEEPDPLQTRLLSAADVVLTKMCSSDESLDRLLAELVPNMDPAIAAAVLARWERAAHALDLFAANMNVAVDRLRERAAVTFE
jgi:hypothetical protein